MRPLFVPIEALEIVQFDGLDMPIHKGHVVAPGQLGAGSNGDIAGGRTGSLPTMPPDGNRSQADGAGAVVPPPVV